MFLIVFFFSLLSAPSSLLALERHIHASAGAESAQQLPTYAAKDLGLFEKYGLDVELLVIRGSSTLLQALVSGSIHSANNSAIQPTRAILSGAQIVITGTILNTNLYAFVARKDIRKPSDLRGKKIAIASFGGANQFSVLIALKAWGIPANTVKLLVAGNNLARMTAIEAGQMDATVIPISSVGLASEKGMNILANIPDIVKEFPDRTIVMPRSFLKNSRGNAKRFYQAVSETIYRLKAEPQLREKTVAIMAKRFRMDRKLGEEAYDTYHNVFSFPPRTGRRGLQDVLEIIQQETGRPEADFALSRFLDESIVDELEHEKFFNFK